MLFEVLLNKENSKRIKFNICFNSVNKEYQERTKEIYTINTNILDHIFKDNLLF